MSDERGAESVITLFYLHGCRRFDKEKAQKTFIKWIATTGIKG